MSDVIHVESLYKTYGEKKALDNFSLNVPQGTIFGLLGPNGAGKTTAIEILLGLRTSDKGESRVFGEDPATSFMRIAPRIGAMLQQGGINPGLKPREALNLYAAFYPKSLDVAKTLERVDLNGVETSVRRLSGGQAQSLSLAIAIVGKPELVFLDEPTVGMDPRSRRRTWDIIRELREAGTTVVLTTHLMDEAEMLCDEIAIVSNGKVIATGDPGTLTHSSQQGIDVTFHSDIDLTELASHIASPIERIQPLHYRISAEATPERISAIAQYAQNKGVTISELSTKSTLEDVFIELTSQGEEE